MAKGGARWGAGRPGYRVKAEQLHRIDIRQWRQRGLLWDGGSNSWSWSRGGEPTGNIQFTVSAESIWLAYSINGNDASQNIHTTTTPCGYGGSRRWFSCPACRGRCEVLYQRSGRFACRSCQRVSYTSQSGSESDRTHARYHKLHALVENGKPKWQRWSTFNRLEEKFERADENANQMLWKVIQRLSSSKC